MSNHYRSKAHLKRIGLSDTNHCDCGEGFEDIEHVVWVCSKYEVKRQELIDSLPVLWKPPNATVHDALFSRNPNFLNPIYKFLKAIDFPE